MPLPAATVLLLRDGTDGLEVFMATRHQKSSFLAGALVFPGGGVEPGDADPGFGLAEPDGAARIAAIREAFEEVGVLLACRRGSSLLIGPDALAPIEASYRDRLNSREIGFARMMAAEDLVPAASLLVPFAHWITPAGLPKRFDTLFYAVRAPEGQLGLHDDREVVGARWVRPQDALAEAASRQVRLVFATRLNLERLAQSDDVEAALEAARARPVVKVLPMITATETGRTIHIPAEAGYGITEMAMTEE